MSSKKTKLGRFAKECLCHLQELPNSPCPSALRRQEHITAGKRETPDIPGCPWSCASAKFNFCFWCLADDDSFDAHSVKEIAASLALSPAQIDKALSLAIEKLQQPEVKEDLIVLSEIVHDLNNNQDDNTLYLVYSLAEIVPKNIGDVSITEVNSLLGEKKKWK